MTLIDTARHVLAQADKLRAAKAANEANTKALLIEPTLGALGWNPANLDAVQREVRVYDGTYLDYALQDKAAACLYIEAKALGENLDDPKHVAQSVNYANNDGVLWCVLTNGVRWRVYKTNEPVAMDRKLLFEVDLADPQTNVTEAVRKLALLSRDEVLAGGLDRLAERTFTDGRVRQALGEIASEARPEFIEQVQAKLGPPAVGQDALLRSLRRVLDAPLSTPPSDPGTSGSASVGRLPTHKPVRGQEYPLEHHLANRSALIVELFTELNLTAMAYGADVTRRIRKLYVGFFRGKKSFCTVELQRQRVLVYLSLKPDQTQPWSQLVMRDVSNIGHFGMGDVEYSLSDPAQLEEVRQLMQLAYDKAG